MSDKELNYITETLLKSYSNSTLIDRKYISKLLETLKDENELNDTFQTIFTCKNMINNYLVEQARSNEDILLELVFDMASIKERICLKLKLDVKDSLYDDYLMEGILSYDGSKSLDLYLSSFLMQKIKMKYVPEKSTKKLEYKGNGSNNSPKVSEPKRVIEVTPVVVEKVKEDILKEETSIQEQGVEEIKEEVVKKVIISQTTDVTEPRELTKKQLKNAKRRDAKKEPNNEKKEESVSFEVPIEDLEDLIKEEVSEPEEIEDITASFFEPLDEEENVKVSSQVTLPSSNLVVKLYQFFEAHKEITFEDNEMYQKYSYLRFREENTLEDIATNLGISLKEVIDYEIWTATELRCLLNKDLSKKTNASLDLKR